MNKEPTALMIAAEGADYDQCQEVMNLMFNNYVDVSFAAPTLNPLRTWRKEDWGPVLQPVLSFQDAVRWSFDCLVICGGLLSVETLRNNELAIKLLSDFVENQKTVATISHGSMMLTHTPKVDDLKCAAASSIAIDLENAGARVCNKSVISSRNFITARDSAGIAKFVKKICKKVKVNDEFSFK